MKHIQKLYTFDEWCKINGKQPLMSLIKEYQKWYNEMRKSNSKIIEQRKQQNKPD